MPSKKDRDYFRSKGLCIHCGGRKDRTDRSKCKKCRDKTNAHSRLRYSKCSEELYAYLFGAQEGLCAVCRRPDLLVADHDHRTEQVRGLLCQKCNRGLGSFDDSPETLIAAALYLRSAEFRRKKAA